jgi:hypothetical protein
VTNTLIRHRFEAYQEARRILASSYTSVAERAAAIAIRDEFMADAPKFVAYLLGVDTKPRTVA